MPSGYFCIVNEKKVEKAVYLNNDADISCYGFEILKAIIDNKLNEWVRKTKGYTPQFGTSVSAFSLDWIRMNPNVKKDQYDKYDFYENGYIYNSKTGMLKVYIYGELIYSIPENERKKYLYFFKYADTITPYLCYNPEKMDYDYDKPLGSIIADASIEDMKNYFEKGNAPRLELSDYHFTVVGHFPETPHYLKRFRVSTNPLYSIDFIVTKEMNDTWNILVELPYSRSNVANGFSSEEAAVRYLRSFIRKNKEELIRYIEIDAMYSYWYLTANMDFIGIFNTLDEEWKKAPWYTFNDAFSVNAIKEKYRDTVDKIEIKINGI
mgnify:CR=1 FL=1